MNPDIDHLVSMLKQADDDTGGKYIDQITDLYRGGADLRTLIPLLEHPDSGYVSLGASIVSEVADGNRGREIFQHLAALLTHPSPSVRFAVIASVTMLVKPSELSVIRALFMLAADPNPGVRRHALYYLCLIPDDIVAALRDSELWTSARLMLYNVTKNEIRSAITSGELLHKRLAVAGALRKFGNDSDFIKELLPSLDDEILECLPTLPKELRSA